MRKQDLAWQLRERSLFEWTVPDEWRLNKQGGFVFEFLPAQITLKGGKGTAVFLPPRGLEPRSFG